MSDDRRPHVERTAFTVHKPPIELTLYFCPACGQMIRGTYNLEPSRKKCTKLWHLTEPIGRKYVAVK